MSDLPPDPPEDDTELDSELHDVVFVDDEPFEYQSLDDLLDPPASSPAV